MFSIISILPVIVSAAGLDPAYDESLFSDSSVPLDLDQIASPSPFDLSVLPGEPEADASELLPWGENDDSVFLSPSLDVAAADDFFQLADCSASGDLPAFGKSRVRQLDESGLCVGPTPAVGTQSGSAKGGNSDMIDLDTLLQSDNIQKMLEDHFANEKRNPFCFWYTSGLFPWGVCSSGNPADETPALSTPMQQDLYNRFLPEFTLSHGTLGNVGSQS